MTKGDNEGINRFVSFYGNTNIEEDLSMNKTELVAAIAEKAELSKKDSEKALKAFIDVVTDERAAREGRNPTTGATIKIPASKAPKFKAGKALKDAVNK